MKERSLLLFSILAALSLSSRRTTVYPNLDDASLMLSQTLESCNANPYSNPITFISDDARLFMQQTTERTLDS